MAKLLQIGRDHKVRHRLLRRHTEEGSAPPLIRSQVKRSTSAGERGREGGQRKETIAPCIPSSLAVPLSSLEVRARRLAWSVKESVTPSFKQPTQARPRSCVTRPSRPRLTNSTKQSSPLPATQTQDDRGEVPEAINDPEVYTCIGSGVQITKVEPVSKASQTRHDHHRLRSDSWPEITARETARRASLTYPTYRNKLKVEPYDGLTIQRAPIFTGPSRNAAPSSPGHEADEESDGEESEPATPAKSRGYWTKGGSTFLPFSKLFTKPRQVDQELEVGNSLQQLSQSEQEVIHRTRRVLKQRLTSANRRRGNNDDKIHLSIFVSPPGDGDYSSGGEEFRSPFFRTSIPIQSEDHQEDITHLPQHAYTPPHLVPRKGTRSHSLIRRSCGGRRVMGRGFFRRPRRKEVTTMMSQVSPVPSDHESRPEHNASQGQGGLLQAILTDAETYAVSRERCASVATPVRRGRRKFHLQVHIKTERIASSAEDDEVDGMEETGRGRRQGPPRYPQELRTMGARVRGHLPQLPPPTRRPATHTPTHAHPKDKGKLRQILEVCSAKVQESLVLSRRLTSGGILVCLDTLQRGLMTPTEYRVYQEHLLEEKQKEQQVQEEQRKEEEEERKRRKNSNRSNISSYKR